MADFEASFADAFFVCYLAHAFAVAGGARSIIAREPTGQSVNDAIKSEVLFYHLERSTLETVLPSLLERTLSRGWTALLKASSQERLAALDQMLWTYSEDSFLPHGNATAGNAQHQPVLLSLDDDRPNGAQVCFVVDGAEAPRFPDFVRTVIMFDGRNPDAVGKAREQWKSAKAEGCPVTYWQQDASGRWVDALAARGQ